MSALLQHAAEVYALDYFGTIIGVSVLEWAIPHRPVAETVRLRWSNNFGVSILNAILLRAAVPARG